MSKSQRIFRPSQARTPARAYPALLASPVFLAFMAFLVFSFTTLFTLGSPNLFAQTSSKPSDDSFQALVKKELDNGTPPLTTAPVAAGTLPRPVVKEAVKRDPKSTSASASDSATAAAQTSPPVSISEAASSPFMKAFGASQDGDGKLSFDKYAMREHPRLLNFLVLSGVGSDLRAILYRRESCGARAYQFFTARLNSKDSVGIVFNCLGECRGVVEEAPSAKENQDKETRISSPATGSKTTDLPKALCEGLWGGALSIEDVHGL